MQDPDLSKPHHHGDLRAALINAGISLLEEGGTKALTLRQCAARAGVSHAAPAHHFDGVNGLKSAIALEGFRLFCEYMEAGKRAADKSPRGQLSGICRGYLGFATENRALFTLIFGFDAKDFHVIGPADDPDRAYLILKQACAPFVPPGQDPTIIEGQVWSLIHGYTLLSLGGRLRPTGGDNAKSARFDDIMSLLDRIGTDPQV